MLGFQPRKKNAEPPAQQVQQPGLGFQPGMSKAGAGAALAQAQNQQPDTIPGMFKPGEFVLPPDTVHAMGGKDALQAVVDQTHTPAPDVAIVPRGYRPQAFFAQGGSPEDDPAAQMAAQTAQRKSAAQASALAEADAAASAATQAASGPTKAAAAAASQPSEFLSTPQARAGLSQGQMPTPSAPAPAAAAPAPATEELPEWSRNQSSYGEQMSKVGGFLADIPKHIVSAPGYGFNSSPKPASAATAAAPVPAIQGNLTGAPSAGGGRGSVNPPLANPNTTSTTTAAAAPTAPSAAPAPSGMVTREGNSYSGANVAGDITINGAAPRNGGAISARNDQAAENLAAGFRPGMGNQIAAAPQPGLGFGPGSVLERQQQAGFTGVIGQQGGNGNMWSRTPEQQRRDAEVQASSIHRPTAALGVNALRSFEAQDLENVRGANALQRASLEQTAANARAAGQNATELQRTGMQQQGETTRAGFRARSDAERNQIDRDRLGMEQTASGFQTRAAQQMENLQKTYMDPNSTPEQRLQAQQAILALQGKSPEGRWKAVALQGGTDAQGNKTESVLGAVNEQTGEMRRYGGQAGQGPGQAVKISNDDAGRKAFASLPSGAEFVGPDGVTYRKG